MITGNEPVMPSILGCNYIENGVIPEPYNGLTIRQHFAAMAMQGLVANSIPGLQHNTKAYASEAVEIADALIAELNKNINS